MSAMLLYVFSPHLFINLLDRCWSLIYHWIFWQLFALKLNNRLENRLFFSGYLYLPEQFIFFWLQSNVIWFFLIPSGIDMNDSDGKVDCRSAGQMKGSLEMSLPGCSAGERNNYCIWCKKHWRKGIPPGH